MPGNKGSDQTDEVRQLRRDLARVAEESSILEKATMYFARDAK